MHHTSHDSILQLLPGILEHTTMITYFVLVMMVLIEYLAIVIKGDWSRRIDKAGKFKMLIAAILGATPGCLGTFTVVSLYIHRIFCFGPLLATTIATTGDEAFVMFSMIPRQALILNLILIPLALLSGWMANLVLGKRVIGIKQTHIIDHHKGHDHFPLSLREWGHQLRSISFNRALLIAGGVLFLIFLFFHKEFQGGWGWEKITFLVATLIWLFIVFTVPEHFLSEHLWKHTIKKHIPRIFGWTLVAFFVIEVGLQYLHLEEWIRANPGGILIIALLVGLIPQSGPHIIFITLFAGGAIPFSVLLGNSIVQDGHGAIPLLAESGKTFLWIKLVKFCIGLIVGGIGILAGF